MAQTGWSPSDVVSLISPEIKMKDGKPHHIERDREKTGSPIVAQLPPDLAEDLALFLKVEHPKGRLFSCRADAINQQWQLWCEANGLPRLRPKEMRHWVATTCRKAGLSKQASAYLMGHDATSGGSMRDWYDQPHIEEILAEQAKILPDGPIGFLMPPKVEIVDRDADILALWAEYKAGKISSMEFSSRAEGIKSLAPKT